MASDGGLFSFNAPFFGSMGGKPLNSPVVGMALNGPTGGYYEVASDGGLFAFHATFYGSMGGKPLNKPMVGMSAQPDGSGYSEVASDGGLFFFRRAVPGFHGGYAHQQTDGRHGNELTSGTGGSRNGQGLVRVRPAAGAARSRCRRDRS